MKKLRLSILALLSAVGLLFTLSGCGASAKGYNVNVVRYPDFWETPDSYHTLGVASTVNDIDPGRYVKATNKQILQGLKTNGTYQVTDLTNVKETDEAITSAAGKTELVLVPTIVSIDEDDTERKSEDANGNPITLLYRYGQVEIQASLYDPNTKDEVVNKSYKDQCSSEGFEKSELKSFASLKQCAVEQATNQMINDLVVTNQSIYFNDCIVLSTNGKISTEFTVNDTIKVGLKLSPKASFNAFTLAIQDQDKSQTILSDEFTWTPEGGIVFNYSAKEIFEKSGGIEKFKAVILTNGKLAYMQEFKIEKPKE